MSIDTPEFVAVKDNLIACGVRSANSGSAIDVQIFLAAEEEFLAVIDAHAAQRYEAGFREGLADRLVGEVKREVVLEDKLVQALVAAKKGTNNG